MKVHMSLSFAFRKAISAAVWLVLPSFTLLAFRSSAWETAFRARPFNGSYDAMFIAAMAGLGLSSLWAMYSYRKFATASIRPAEFSRWNAFDIFEVFLCASLAASNFTARATASALVWAMACLSLGAATASFRPVQRRSTSKGKTHPSLLGLIESVFLVCIAALIIVFAVLQPWSGLPEPFVRWHPFGVEPELIWRGVFLSFALGMLLTATDPGGRHRLFLVALVLSGYLHSTEMAIDNLLSARVGGMNGNPEHLYGDVLGWFAIASLSLLFLLLNRPRKAQ